MPTGLLETPPIAVVYAGVALLMLASFEAGYRFGRREHPQPDDDTSSYLSPMVGGLLGMLAFVLALTFSMAASQHELRKQNVMDEANAVGTAYLRADLLDEQYRTVVKRLLREYVDIRLQATRGGDLQAALKRSVEIHGLLWDAVSSAARTSPSPNTTLMIQSVNEIIDMHEKRVTAALRNRIPGSVWLALFLISSLTMVTMGAQISYSGNRRLVAIIPMSLAFAVLVTLVADLDHPQRGLITVGQQAMVDLQSSMQQR